MQSRRKEFQHLLEAGSIKNEQIHNAVEAIQLYPNSRAWRTFIDKTLLYTGSVAISLSLLFLIAYNWANFGRFGKFALVQAFMVAAVLAYVKYGGKKKYAQATMAAAVISIGVLLALFGQTYQTGADPWQLFATWSVLMLPWALIANSASIWIIFVVLLNVSLILYQKVFPVFWWFDTPSSAMSVFAINTGALLVWEATRKQFAFLNEDWAVWLLALASGVSITWAMFGVVFRSTNDITGLIWVAWLAAIYLFYRHIRLDVLVIAVGCLSAIVVITLLIGKGIFEISDPIFALFFLAVVVVTLGGLSAKWLRFLHQEKNA